MSVEIEVHQGSLHLKRCYFDGHRCHRCIDCWLKACRDTIEIVGCTFTNYGDIIKLPDPEEGTDGEEYPVIEMFYDEPSIDDIEEIAESIEIVGNIFSNNKGRSIVFTDNNDA
eukprot:327663_1